MARSLERSTEIRQTPDSVDQFIQTLDIIDPVKLGLPGRGALWYVIGQVTTVWSRIVTRGLNLL